MKSEITVILSIIHNCQNPLESTATAFDLCNEQS
jgi:hypothetical protein